ncbi:MAG: DUF4112 domain-containing protein [Bradymonadaceae bacterium]
MAGDSGAELAERSDRAIRSIRRLEGLADLMDDSLEIPIVKYRIGLDPLLGLLPVGGDWVAWTASIYIFWEAIRLDAPRPLLFRMAWNLLVDLLAGTVPLAGDAFDAVFKANRKNVALLRDHLDLPASPDARDEIELDPDAGPSRAVAIGLGIAVTLASLLLASLPFLLAWWLLG